MLPGHALATPAEDLHPIPQALQKEGHLSDQQKSQSSQELSPLDAQRCKGCCCRHGFALHLSSLPVHEFLETLAVDVGKLDSPQRVGTRPCCGWAH